MLLQAAYIENLQAWAQIMLSKTVKCSNEKPLHISTLVCYVPSPPLQQQGRLHGPPDGKWDPMELGATIMNIFIYKTINKMRQIKYTYILKLFGSNVL